MSRADIRSSAALAGIFIAGLALISLLAIKWLGPTYFTLGCQMNGETLRNCRIIRSVWQETPSQEWPPTDLLARLEAKGYRR